jgi:hypothetical protein
MDRLSSSNAMSAQSSTAPVLQFTSPFLDFFDPASGLSWTECLLSQPLAAPPSAASSVFELHELAGDEDVLADPVWRLRRIFERLDATALLGQNWDSYGSEPPSDEARSKARELIWNVAAQYFGAADLRAVPFTLVPLSGGGVQVEWQGASNVIEVEIGPHGSLGYLLARGQEPHREFEERDDVSKEDLLDRIRAALS